MEYGCGISAVMKWDTKFEKKLEYREGKKKRKRKDFRTVVIL